MKYLASLILISLLIFSCSDTGFNADTYPQKWKLVKMYGSMIPFEDTGDDMAWQESLTFYSDNTFLKTRERDGTTTEVSGTYKVEDNSERKHIVLTYEAENELIASCSQLKEHLYYSFPYKLTGTWQACDGAGLEYKRVE